MNSWYEENIEPGVRKVVKLLRDNGFNTECSCEHQKYVQCQYITDGELKRLDDILFWAGFEDYTITTIIKRIEGHAYNTIQLDFKTLEV